MISIVTNFANSTRIVVSLFDGRVIVMYYSACTKVLLSRLMAKLVSVPVQSEPVNRPCGLTTFVEAFPVSTFRDVPASHSWGI